MSRFFQALRWGLSALAVVCFCRQAPAFDWKPQPNEKLRADMIAFMKTVVKDTKEKPIREAVGAALEKLEAEEPDSYNWMDDTYKLVEKLMAQYPPEPKHAAVRMTVLRILDFPLHFDDRNPKAPKEGQEEFVRATGEYFARRRAAVIRQIRETVPPEGNVAFWNIYNMAFVVKTPKQTVVIDLTDRPSFIRVINDPVAKSWRLEEGFQSWTGEDVDALVQMADVCFITHMHGDHLHKAFLQKMIKAGKKIVVPTPMLECSLHGFPMVGGGRQPFDFNKLADIPAEQQIVLDKSSDKPRDICGVRVLNFHGAQGKEPCNVYLLEIGGVRFAHNGDNGVQNMELQLKKYPAANIIIGSSWNNFPHLVNAAAAAPGAGKARQLLVPAHNNELGHGPANRESYRELFTQDARLKSYMGGEKQKPYVAFSWGEGMIYPAMKGLPLPVE